VTDAYAHSSYATRERAVEIVAGYDGVETNEKYVKMGKGQTLRLASRTV